MIRIKSILVALAFLTIILYGCSTNPNPKYKFDLCNYKDLPVSEETYDVSIEDLNTSLSLYATTIDERFEDYTSLTDEIVKEHFGYNTVFEFKEYVLKEIITHRIVDSIYEKILTESRVSLRDEAEFDDYYKRRLFTIEQEAKSEKTDINNYIKENKNMSISEFKEDECSFFVTILILKEILKSESASIPQQDIDNTRSTISSEMGFSLEESYQYILDEDIFYSLAETKMYDFIPQWYKATIDDAFYNVRSKLNFS